MVGEAPSETGATATTRFVSDLTLSWRVLVLHPLLPGLTFLLALLTQYVLVRHYDAWSQPLWLLGWVLMAGWVGTQRVWFLRAFRCESMRPSELVTLTARFIPRFSLLGFLILVASVLPVALASALAHDAHTLFTLWAVLPVIMAVATDIVLTFVTPALVYSTSKLRRAFVLGVRLLLDEWPRCAWYAFVPPLAIVVLIRFIPVSALGPVGTVAIGVSSLMLGLWLKGAIAAYYLRVQGVLDQGGVATLQPPHTFE